MYPSTLLSIALVLLVITGALYVLIPSETRAPPADPLGSKGKNKQNEKLRRRLVHAGFYGKNAMVWMSIAKSVSLVIPLIVATVTTYLTGISIRWTASIGLGVAIAGIIGPSFVLDHFKRKRQLRLSRAIPDALDVLTICLEAGMSLPGALLKVSQELSSAHPELATELAIVNRETLLGRSVGDSMRALADRFDIEELRSLSSVIVQAEKYGSSLVDAMDVFAISMRQKRMNAAESHAQQAVAKILIPTVLCILPSLFLVTLGPAVIMIIKGLENT